MKRISITISKLIILGASCIGIFWFSITNPNLRCFGTLLPSNSDIEKFARIQFPPSANITYELEGDGRLQAPTCTLWLQFEIRPDDLDTLRNSSLVYTFENRDVVQYGDQFIYFMERMNWSQPTNSLTGFGLSAYPYVSQLILIDTNDPNNWMVYAIVDEQKHCQFLLFFCL